MDKQEHRNGQQQPGPAAESEMSPRQEVKQTLAETADMVFDMKTGGYVKAKAEKTNDMAEQVMLRVRGLNVYYGKIHALHGVDFKVNKGEIVSLIGANGAGKTTTLQAVSGLLTARSGEISFDGQLIDKVPPHLIVRRGLAHVPEGRRMFTHLTVEDNLQMGAYCVHQKSKISDGIERSYEMFPRLKERRRQLAGTLSGGEQQMLAIARALMSEPSMILLDEPSMGLSPILVQEIFRIIKNINNDGTTVLLVEQNAQMALCLSDRAYVLESGRVTLKGAAKDLLSNAEVQAAYLGA